MTAALSRSEAWSLLALSSTCLGIIANTFQGYGAPLIVSLAFSGLAYSVTYALVRWLGPTFIAAGLKGKDMSKAVKKEMYCGVASNAPLTTLLTASNSPEAMGAVGASIYLLILIAFIPFPFYKDIVAATSGGGNRDVVIQVAEVETGRFLHRFPHSKVRQAPLNVIVPLNQDSLSASFRHTCPLCSRCIQRLYWGLRTIFSTSVGVTKCLSLRSLLYLYFLYTTLTLESPPSSFRGFFSHTYQTRLSQIRSLA